MSAVPGVPVEAIEAAQAALDEHMLADSPPTYVTTAALAAALPSLRELIAAEVLNAAAEDWWARDDVASKFETWHWLRKRAEALSAPVQAAEKVGGYDD